MACATNDFCKLPTTFSTTLIIARVRSIEPKTRAASGTPSATTLLAVTPTSSASPNAMATRRGSRKKNMNSAGKLHKAP